MRKLSLDELGRATVDEYKGSKKLPVVLVLDNIRSGVNVGSIFRTSDGFAIERLVLTGITPSPPHREINKTAIGATESVEWISVDSPSEAIKDLQSEGYQVFLVEQTEPSVSLDQFVLDVNGKYAFVLGNEVNGVSDEIVELVKQSVEVPQYGTKHSFNVAVCTGILLWECSRQLR